MNGLPHAKQNLVERKLSMIRAHDNGSFQPSLKRDRAPSTIFARPALSSRSDVKLDFQHVISLLHQDPAALRCKFGYKHELNSALRELNAIEIIFVVRQFLSGIFDYMILGILGSFKHALQFKNRHINSNFTNKPCRESYPPLTLYEIASRDKTMNIIVKRKE